MSTISPPLRNTIRTWALVAVGLTSVFLVGMTIWLVLILSANDWCDRAINASEVTGTRPEAAVVGCYTLLGKQVDSLALTLTISIATISLCLAVLVVIVLAGGRLSFKGGMGGVEASVSSASDAAAAQTTSAPQDVADDYYSEHHHRRHYATPPPVPPAPPIPPLPRGVDSPE